MHDASMCSRVHTVPSPPNRRKLSSKVLATGAGREPTLEPTPPVVLQLNPNSWHVYAADMPVRSSRAEAQHCTPYRPQVASATFSYSGSSLSRWVMVTLPRSDCGTGWRSAGASMKTSLFQPIMVFIKHRIVRAHCRPDSRRRYHSCSARAPPARCLEPAHRLQQLRRPYAVRTNGNWLPAWDHSTADERQSNMEQPVVSVAAGRRGPNRLHASQGMQPSRQMLCRTTTYRQREDGGVGP